MNTSTFIEKALTILWKTVRVILAAFGIMILGFIGLTIYSVFHAYRDEELKKDDMMKTIRYGGIIQDNDIEEVLYARRTGRSMGQDPYIANAVIVRMNSGVIEKLVLQESYSGSNLSMKKDVYYHAHECFRPILKDSNQSPELTELLTIADSRSPEVISRLTFIESPKANHSFVFDKKTRLALICELYYGEGSPWSE